MGDVKTHTAVLADALNPTLSTGNSATSTTADRIKAVEHLHLSSFTAITNTIRKDSRLNYEDACFIHGGLRPLLTSYDGELTADAFLAWALEAVRLPIEFYVMRRQDGRCVFAGAWSVLRNATDLGDTAEAIRDIEADTWVWLLTDKKRSPLYADTGAGRTSTRLYGRARWAGRAWKTKQLRNRAKFANLDDIIQAEGAAA
jgi:hypothetical protein